MIVVLMTTARMLRSRMKRKFHVRFCTGGGVVPTPPTRITLLTSVVAEKAKAEFKNGVLIITLPKAEEVKPRTIAVKAK